MPFIRRNNNRPDLQALRVWVYRSSIARSMGLMFWPYLPLNRGLLLDFKKAGRKRSAIHMLFVFFPLAVFWLDEKMCVVDKAKAYPFVSFLTSRKPARYVLELRSALLERFAIGDVLEIEAE